MEEWTKYNWGQISELKYGKGLKGYRDLQGEIPVYGTNGYIGQTEKALCKKEGIIVGRKGAYRGIHYSPIPFNVIDTAFYLVPTIKNLDIKFAYYQLLTQDINGLDSGSAIPSTSREDFYRLKVSLPSLQEQKSIASILSALDDKIELNLQMNKTLEEMAMALYKHWFVDFGPFQEGEFVGSELGEIPKGWEIRRLDEILEIKRGGSPRPIKDFIATEGLHWLKISDATASNSPFLYSTKEFIKKEGLKKTILIKPGNIILSNSATPGLPRLIEFETCIHDGWLHFPKISRFNRYILYLLFLDIKEHLIQQGNGSVFTNLKTDILKSQLIKLPPMEVEQNFSNQIIPWFEQIKSNTEENLALTALRDTLLPKLISGEVRVKDAEKTLSEVL